MSQAGALLSGSFAEQIRGKSGGVVPLSLLDLFDDSASVRVGDPVLSLVQLDPIRVKVNVPEAAVSSVGKDTEVTFTLDALPGESFSARVEAVRDEIMKAKQGFTDDSLKLYKGPLKDNEGNVVLKEGEVIDNEDTKFKLGVRFFVEGAVGETGLK